MTKEEIRKAVAECPYSNVTIDTLCSCDLEWHYRKICPSSECLCAKRFGLNEVEAKCIEDEITTIVPAERSEK